MNVFLALAFLITWSLVGYLFFLTKFLHMRMRVADDAILILWSRLYPKDKKTIKGPKLIALIDLVRDNYKEIYK